MTGIAMTAEPAKRAANKVVTDDFILSWKWFVKTDWGGSKTIKGMC